MSNPIPQWPASVKGFETFIAQKLITVGQHIAVPVDPKDPETLYVLNIGTTKTAQAGKAAETNYKGHARTMFLKSAAKNLFAIPFDILLRIAKVITFYPIIFGDSSKTFAQRAVSWLSDIGRILVSPLTWPIIVATELFAAIHPSASSRNAVAKLENALLENNKFDYLKPIIYKDVLMFAANKGISAPILGTIQEQSSEDNPFRPDALPQGTNYSSIINTPQGKKDISSLTMAETHDLFDILYGKQPRSLQQRTPQAPPNTTPTPVPIPPVTSSSSSSSSSTVSSILPPPPTSTPAPTTTNIEHSSSAASGSSSSDSSTSSMDTTDTAIQLSPFNVDFTPDTLEPKQASLSSTNQVINSLWGVANTVVEVIFPNGKGTNGASTSSTAPSSTSSTSSTSSSSSASTDSASAAQQKNKNAGLFSRVASGIVIGRRFLTSMVASPFSSPGSFVAASTPSMSSTSSSASDSASVKPKIKNPVEHAQSQKARALRKAAFKKRKLEGSAKK